MNLYFGSHSLMDQESFVISMTQEKRDGFYVELGSADPYEGSNTVLLEKLGWKGLAIDNNPSSVEKYKNSERLNKSIEANAMSFDYKDYFVKNNFPKQIDYLQIDIDGHETANGLLALIALPLATYRFSVIQFEHDCNRNFKFKDMRNAQREILLALSYQLVIQEAGEDWWVDPSAIEGRLFWPQMTIGRPQFSEHKYLEGLTK
jgi:hypothetical protein